MGPCNPDVDGRTAILATHAKGVKVAAGVDWEVGRLVVVAS